MRTHVEWLEDCRRALLRDFEQFKQTCAEIADDEVLPSEICQDIVYSLLGAVDQLKFDDIEESLQYFAIVFAGRYDGLVDGKYSSYHEVMYSPLHNIVAAMREWLESHPDDWPGSVKILKQHETELEQIARLFERHPGLLRRELADAFNYAGGRFKPIAKPVPPTNTVSNNDTPHIRQPDISDILEVDLKTSRVRCYEDWYSTTPDEALFVEKLLGSYPEWYPASKDFTKPSRTKRHLPAAVQALIESKSGKGYRLKLAPEAPDLRRRMPASPAQ